MNDKIIRCSEQIFRPADANSYCQKPAGHKDVKGNEACRFNGVDVVPVRPPRVGVYQPAPKSTETR